MILFKQIQNYILLWNIAKEEVYNNKWFNMEHLMNKYYL